MTKTLQFKDRDYTLISNEHEWVAGAGVAVRLTEVFHMDGNITRLWGVMNGEEHFREALPEEAEQLDAAFNNVDIRKEKISCSIKPPDFKTVLIFGIGGNVTTGWYSSKAGVWIGLALNQSPPTYCIEAGFVTHWAEI